MRGRVLHREATASRGWEMICCGKASNDRQCHGTARQGTAKESHCSEWYRTAGALKGEASQLHCSAVLGNGEAWRGMRWQSGAHRRNGEVTKRAARPCVAVARRGVAERWKCTTTTCEGNGRIRKPRHSKGEAAQSNGKAMFSYAVARQRTDLTGKGKARRLPAMAEQRDAQQGQKPTQPNQKQNLN